jgi:hypothetical protein
MWITIVYVTGVANLTEIWENNRVRFIVDPYAWVIFGVFVQHVLRVRTTRRSCAESDDRIDMSIGAP